MKFLQIKKKSHMGYVHVYNLYVLMVQVMVDSLACFGSFDVVVIVVLAVNEWVLPAVHYYLASNELIGVLIMLVFD